MTKRIDRLRTGKTSTVIVGILSTRFPTNSYSTHAYSYWFLAHFVNNSNSATSPLKKFNYGFFKELG